MAAFAKTSTPHDWTWASQRPGPIGVERLGATLSFDVVTTTHDLAALEPEWTALWLLSAPPAQAFLSFDWVWQWCQHYLPAKATRLAVLVCRQQGRMVAVWPLIRHAHGGLRLVSFLGAPVSQYSDVVTDISDPAHQHWIEEGWRAIGAKLQPDLVHLRKVRGDSAIAPLLKHVGAVASNVEQAPFITLLGESSFAAFDQRYDAKDRKNRRRKRKRLGEMGVIGFRRSQGTVEALAALRQALAWKRDWLDAGARVSAGLSDARFNRFFASVLGASARNAGAEAFELTLDGAPVAIKIAMTQGTCRLLHLTAFDKAYEKSSPGTLLVEEMIAAALADGITRLDFLAPAHDYKLEWASGSAGIADYSVAVSAAGRLYQDVYLQWLRPRLRALAATGPVPLRRLMAAGTRLSRRQ